MKITFEDMREPIRLRGVSADRSTTSARNMRADSVFPLPSSSICKAPLKSADISQATLDIAKLLGAFLFVVVTGLAIAAGGFILLFVRT